MESVCFADGIGMEIVGVRDGREGGIVVVEEVNGWQGERC